MDTGTSVLALRKQTPIVSPIYYGLKLYFSVDVLEEGYEANQGIQISETYDTFLTASNMISSDQYRQSFNVTAGLMADMQASSGYKSSILTWNLVSGPT